MTLAEKVTLLHGVAPWPDNYTGATSPITRLGVPALRLNDGRQGYRGNANPGTSTAWPCELGVVATWDADRYQDFGAAMGDEFFRKGANVALTPMLILARVPQGGRNFESCGEDPHLCGVFGAGETIGTQSVPGMITNIDDFVMNNQETDRQGGNAEVDERSAQELYMPAYEASVRAGAGSFMCSYNRVNGSYACANNKTLNVDLKGRMGFEGWVLSDWGGTHSTVKAAMNGLDQEMPGATYFGDALLAAAQNGTVPMWRIDDMALRVLTPMYRFGVFDTPNPNVHTANVTTVAHNQLARALSAEGTVLLKNDASAAPNADADANVDAVASGGVGGGAQGGLLPLTWKGMRGVAVIGADGHDDPQCCGTGSGAVAPPYVVTPFQGIAAAVSAANGSDAGVTYTNPTPPVTLNTYWSKSRGDHFLFADCTAWDGCAGVYVEERPECQVFATAAQCESSVALGGGNRSRIHRNSNSSTPSGASCTALQLWWDAAAQKNTVTTAAHAPVAGSGYKYVQVVGYIVNTTSATPAHEAALVPLELWSDAGTGDTFTVATDASRAEAKAGGYKLLAQLGFVDPPSSHPGPAFPSAVAAAKAADVAIVCLSVTSGEGHDRASLNFTASDDALVAAVANANTNTIVVMHNPGAMVMPWADLPGVRAIVAAWFPGQEMGNALADVLDGTVNPSGRLPLSFPVQESDSPLQTPEQYPGVNGTVTYTERLQVGYRWFNSAGVAPRYPFGHGLSYSSFSFSALTVNNWTVSVTVTNDGAVAGRHVAQLYLTYPAGTDEPPRQLRRFAKTAALAPGASTVVSFAPLSWRDVSVWDVTLGGWRAVLGEFTVAIGDPTEGGPTATLVVA